MYLPFPRGLFSSDKSIYYTVDNYHFIKEMYKKDWNIIEHTVEKIEEYLNNPDDIEKKWDNFKYFKMEEGYVYNA